MNKPITLPTGAVVPADAVVFVLTMQARLARARQYGEQLPCPTHAERAFLSRHEREVNEVSVYLHNRRPD